MEKMEFIPTKKGIKVYKASKRAIQGIRLTKKRMLLGYITFDEEGQEYQFNSETDAVFLNYRIHFGEKDLYQIRDKILELNRIYHG